MWRTVTLGEVAGGRDNNFNLIRMIGAGAVMVSHAWPLTQGPSVDEPLERTLGFTLGVAGVYIFFAISGFLITRSFDRRPELSDFIAARFLRLFPALLASLLATAFVMGPFVTTLDPSAYFTSLDVYTYTPRGLGLIFPQYELPGVFQSVPYGDSVIGTLWSLFYEVACYGMVFTLGILGAIKRRIWFSIFIIVYAIFFVGIAVIQPIGFGQYQITKFQETSYPFVLGMALYVWRERIPLSWMIAAALAVASVVAHGTPVFHYVFMAALTYGVFTFAYLPKSVIRAYNNLGDYSYGLYIYGFPAQQLAAQYAPSFGPWGNLVVAMPLTLALAVLSWVVIEKPALASKTALGHWMRKRFPILVR